MVKRAERYVTIITATSGTAGVSPELLILLSLLRHEPHGHDRRLRRIGDGYHAAVPQFMISLRRSGTHRRTSQQ
jgi:hypothetical protein